VGLTSVDTHVITEVTETQMDNLVDLTPGVKIPALDDPLTLQAFIEDVAQKIHDYPTIARRYGFSSERAMMEHIRDSPELRRRIKARRAIWESDGNAESRARAYAVQTVIEAIPHTSQVMFDQAAPHSARLDALKAHARIGGIDGLPSGSKDVVGPGMPGQGRFAINIIFKNHPSEKITTIETVDLPGAPDEASDQP
jgi:hypothetical protein